VGIILFFNYICLPTILALCTIRLTLQYYLLKAKIPLAIPFSPDIFHLRCSQHLMVHGSNGAPGKPNSFSGERIAISFLLQIASVQRTETK